MLPWCKISASSVMGGVHGYEGILVDNSLVHVWSPVTQFFSPELWVGVWWVCPLGGCQPCVTCHHISMLVLGCALNCDLAFQGCKIGSITIL